MIDKFSGTIITATATMGIKDLVWCADWWDASLWLSCTIVHITRAGCPKILWYARLSHCTIVNPQYYRWIIRRGNQSLLSTASKATSALLQSTFRAVTNKIWPSTWPILANGNSLSAYFNSLSLIDTRTKITSMHSLDHQLSICQNCQGEP